MEISLVLSVLFSAQLSSAYPVSLRLEDVFISVKTSGKFHKTRLTPILETWFQTAPEQTWFFTDSEDPGLNLRTGGHLINTGCPADHSRTALSCKMEAELTEFLKSEKSWFCHVDDDNYLNARSLVKILAKYTPEKDWYLGKVSIPQPLEILDRLVLPTQRKVRFWFATGGAGFCLSRSMAEKMRPWIDNGQFQKLADEIRLPDDVTVGYISEVLLQVPLEQVPQFHSHLEPLRLVSHPETEITLSYSQYEDSGEMNLVELDGGNDIKENILNDETMFYAVHCKLYPRSCSTQ